MIHFSSSIRNNFRAMHILKIYNTTGMCYIVFGLFKVTQSILTKPCELGYGEWFW